MKDRRRANASKEFVEGWRVGDRHLVHLDLAAAAPLAAVRSHGQPRVRQGQLYIDHVNGAHAIQKAQEAHDVRAEEAASPRDDAHGEGFRSHVRGRNVAPIRRATACLRVSQAVHALLNRTVLRLEAARHGTMNVAARKEGWDATDGVPTVEDRAAVGRRHEPDGTQAGRALAPDAIRQDVSLLVDVVDRLLTDKGAEQLAHIDREAHGYGPAGLVHHAYVAVKRVPFLVPLKVEEHTPHVLGRCSDHHGCRSYDNVGHEHAGQRGAKKPPAGGDAVPREPWWLIETEGVRRSSTILHVHGEPWAPKLARKVRAIRVTHEELAVGLALASAQTTIRVGRSQAKL